MRHFPQMYWFNYVFIYWVDFSLFTWLLLCCCVQNILLFFLNTFVCNCLMLENHHGCVLVSKQDFKRHILSLQLQNYNMAVSVKQNCLFQCRTEAETLSPLLLRQWVLHIKTYFRSRSSPITNCRLSTEGWCMSSPVLGPFLFVKYTTFRFFKKYFRLDPLILY